MVEHLHHHPKPGRIAGGRLYRVAVSDVLSAHRPARVRNTGPLETACVNCVAGRILERFRSTVLKPGMVESLWVRFSRPGEMPAAVPNLNPAMVPAIIHPHRRSRYTGGHPDGSACVNQQNRQPAARGHAAFHGFERALNCLLALGRIADVDQREELLVKALRGFGRRFAVRDQRQAFFTKCVVPRVARFTDTGVGENFVEEDFVRHLVMPRRLLESVICKRQMLEEKARGKRTQIAVRHVFHQELDSLALRGRGLVQCANQFLLVGSRAAQRLFDRGTRPPPVC